MRIKGKVTRILYQSDSFGIFVLDSEELGSIKCTGAVYGLKEGSNVVIEAESAINPKYGLQYNITSYKIDIPDNEAGIISFLGSGLIKGVGQKTAESIVKKFGTGVLRMIKEDPDFLLQVSGISEKKAKKIVESLSELDGFSEIFSLCNGLVTPNEVTKIIKTFGAKAATIVKTEPYKLLSVSGFGFVKTDKIAMSTGISEYDPARLKAAIDYVLITLAEQTGDCFVLIDTMEKACIQLLCPMPKDVEKIRGAKAKLESIAPTYSRDRAEYMNTYAISADLAAKIDTWVVKRDTLLQKLTEALTACITEGTVVFVGDNALASKKYYYIEDNVAHMVNALKCAKPIYSDIDKIKELVEEYQNDHGFKLTERQQDAVINTLTNRVSIITGGPGTGKTTTIQVIVYVWKKLISSDLILGAPTGRAAQRITDTIPDKDVQSGTVHKLTGMRLLPPAAEPGPKSLIVIDESSMINLDMAEVLCEFASKAPSTICFVGDADQLPPIGAGCFYADMIRSGEVKTTVLTRGFRNAGLIAANSDLINSGSTHLTTGDDFHIEDLDRGLIAERAKKLYMDAVAAGEKIQDMCILTLCRQRGAAAVNLLNQMIQAEYNPAKPLNMIEDCPYRIGDRVMQTKNNYNMEYILNGTKNKGVFNGDLGVITAYDKEEDELTIRFDDGRTAQYDKATDLNDLTLAYAMTVHKSQGSEYKKIFLCCTMDQYTLLSRSIIYTAVTRGKKTVTILCERKALNMAIRTCGNMDRNTRLKELLGKII